MGSWKRYGGALALNLVLALIVLLLKGFGQRIHYIDALGVAGAVSILLGLLFWVASQGAFDTIGYGFSALFTDRKYKDLYDYTARKNENRSRRRKSFVPLLIVGAAFLLVSFLIPLG